MIGNERTGDLGGLRDLLASVVTTLDGIGADGYRHAYVYVSGYRGGRPLGELSLEGNDIWVSTGHAVATHPSYMHADHSANRRALLLSGLCYAMWHWRMSLDDVAGHLGCGAHALESWLAHSSDETPPELPPVVCQRVRRLVVVEELRLLAGVPDAVAPGWAREARQELGGRSVLSVLRDDGEIGFRRIVAWLLDSVAAVSATVH